MRGIQVQLVVLDWAGTVVDFGCQAPAGAFVEAFALKGVPVTIREARGPMGLHKKAHIRAMLQVPDLAARWQQATGRGWTEDDIELLYRLVTPLQVNAAITYSRLVPGLLEVVAKLRAMDLKIAGTTGYFHEAAQACYTAAAEQGYQPDFSICADEVPAGRPEPWMIYRSMEALRVYPPDAVVKVGDTVIDMQDGRNAGVWTVGVVDSSNEMGLSLEEFQHLPDAVRQQRRGEVASKFLAAGCHMLMNTLYELPFAIEQINKALAAGETASSNRILTP